MRCGALVTYQLGRLTELNLHIYPPKVSKKRPGGAKLDLLVFYGVFKRPQSLGGMRCGALITYRLGRLTELNITLINLLCTVKKQTAPTLTRTGVPAGTVRI